MTVLDAIYLNKRGDEGSDENWAYYRVTSLGGGDGDHIEVCLLRWPMFDDLDIVGNEINSPVWNPGDTGFASAHPNLCTLLGNKWKLDHDQSILIGMRERQQ